MSTEYLVLGLCHPERSEAVSKLTVLRSRRTPFLRQMLIRARKALTIVYRVVLMERPDRFVVRCEGWGSFDCGFH